MAFVARQRQLLPQEEIFSGKSCGGAHAEPEEPHGIDDKRAQCKSAYYEVAEQTQQRGHGQGTLQEEGDHLCQLLQLGEASSRDVRRMFADHRGDRKPSLLSREGQGFLLCPANKEHTQNMPSRRE